MDGGTRSRRRRMLAMAYAAGVTLSGHGGVQAEFAAGSGAGTTTSAATACANASMVVVGATDSDAIAYDASCKARAFRVVKPSTGARDLNLSSLDVSNVLSYPRVYTLLLNDNDLTALQAGTDMDMSHLYVVCVARVSCLVWGLSGADCGLLCV